MFLQDIRQGAERLERIITEAFLVQRGHQLEGGRAQARNHPQQHDLGQVGAAQSSRVHGRTDPFAGRRLGSSGRICAHFHALRSRLRHCRRLRSDGRCCTVHSNCSGEYRTFYRVKSLIYCFVFFTNVSVLMCKIFTTGRLDTRTRRTSDSVLCYQAGRRSRDAVLRCVRTRRDLHQRNQCIQRLLQGAGKN